MLAEWEQIQATGEPGDRNVRLVDSAHPLSFRIGRDFKGRYVFQLDASGSADLRTGLPHISGIDCELDEQGAGALRLTLTLKRQEDVANFRLMCAGMMHATSELSAHEAETGLLVVIDQLHRWQEMLRQRRDRLLKRTEIIGLVGELLFLRDILAPRIGMLGAIRSWTGPERDEQDFVLGGTIVEVKTQIVTADRRIRISSEDQLDPVQGRIIIANQGVAPLPGTDPTARSLNGLAAEVRDVAAASGAAACDLLDIALLAAGYEHREEYDEESWVLVDRAFYEVMGDFPRIERAELRSGVDMVKYSIRVADCLPYAVDIDVTMAGFVR
ncbi:PD-(D/E)XK motif protein [Sphingomonas sp. ZT3P38]|uniref:PD-(D/E)XK motif protein n=1 Tax=Parasphingomonas zepuensis TaxID=3096161 RepID=UPI002FCB7CFC